MGWSHSTSLPGCASWTADGPGLDKPTHGRVCTIVHALLLGLTSISVSGWPDASTPRHGQQVDTTATLVAQMTGHRYDRTVLAAQGIVKSDLPGSQAWGMQASADSSSDGQAGPIPADVH